MATKSSLAAMSSLSEEIAQESVINESQLLTGESKKPRTKTDPSDPFALNTARKTGDDEVVMVGVRMTKRHRKLMKSLAVQKEITLQELVRQALSLYRQQEGLR